MTFSTFFHRDHQMVFHLLGLVFLIAVDPSRAQAYNIFSSTPRNQNMAGGMMMGGGGDGMMMGGGMRLMKVTNTKSMDAVPLRKSKGGLKGTGASRSKEVQKAGDNKVPAWYTNKNVFPPFVSSSSLEDPTESPTDFPSPTISPTTLVPPSVPSAFLTNLEARLFNQVGLPFCFNVTVGQEFVQNSDSSINFTVTTATSVSDAPSFLFATGLGQLCTTSSLVTTEGRQDIALRAETTAGFVVELATPLIAGSSNVTVTLLDAISMAAYTGNATVAAQSADVDSVTAIEHIVGGGTAVFTNLPSRTIIFTAFGEAGEFGSAGAVPPSGGSSVVGIVVDGGFHPPSSIDNNDFSQGTSGWELPADNQAAVYIVDHEEDVGPSSGSSGNVRRAQETLFDKDLRLTTVGHGLQQVSRTFVAEEGVTGVAVRYRFVTSEVPGGYFGSQYNDYFFVNIRASGLGAPVSESNSMNGLGLAAFDYDSGSTSWRYSKFMFEDSDSARGRIVQVDVGVANVRDGIFDSEVVVDFVEEMKMSLCIYSNVAEDQVMTANQQEHYQETYPGLLAGHSALMIVDSTTEPDTAITTYGLWPDNIAGLDNGAESDIRVNLDGDEWNPEVYPYIFCHSITEKERTTLDDIVAVPQAWTCTNTCASFASETFYAVTGIDIDADDFLGFETPRELGEHIIDANGGTNVPTYLPVEVQGVGLAESIRESFTRDWISSCYPEGE